MPEFPDFPAGRPSSSRRTLSSAPFPPRVRFGAAQASGRRRLVAGSPGLGDDARELVDLSLGAAEGTEASLGQLAGALVLAVAQQLDDAALYRDLLAISSPAGRPL